MNHVSLLGLFMGSHSPSQIWSIYRCY